MERILDIPELGLTDEEHEVLDSQTLEGLLLRLVLVAQERHITTAARLEETIALAAQEALEVDERYRRALDPEQLATGPEDLLFQLRELASDVVKKREQKENLTHIRQSAQTISLVNYPTLRQTIVSIQDQTGGTPIPQELLEILERPQIETRVPERSLLTQVATLVFTQVISTPEGPSDDFITKRALLPPAEEAPQPPATTPDKGKAEFQKEYEPVFTSWVEVFQDPERGRDNDYIQPFRYVVGRIIEALPEQFGQFGNQHDPSQRVDQLGALDHLYLLTASDINRLFMPQKARTFSSVTRCLSMVHRVGSGDFVEPEHFTSLAQRLREGAYPPDKSVAEILEDEFIAPQEAIRIKQEGVGHFRATQSDLEKFPTTDEEIRWAVGEARESFYRMAREKGVAVTWPMHEGHITMVNGTLRASFLQKTIETNLVKPSGESRKIRGTAVRTYTELDMIKLTLLARCGLRGAKKSQVKAVFKEIDKIYEELFNQPDHA